MEEASYKLVEGPLPVSKRQQWKGLGPQSIHVLSFNSIEALEKNYLAQLPSHSLTDPALHQEREGVLNRIAVDKLVMKNRPSVWGLLKVFLPKACAQRSLCRWSIAQSFEATAELGLWQRVNLTNMKECDVWCDCHVWLWLWSWLDFLDLTWHVLSSRLSRTSLDLNMNLGWTFCYCYR